MPDQLTPEQRGHDVAARWWKVGRELHGLRDERGVYLDPQDVLAQIVSGIVREAEQAAAARERERERAARIARRLEWPDGSELLRIVSADHVEAGRVIAIVIEKGTT